MIEEKGREAVLCGAPQIEREQVGVGLQLILFGYLFGRRIGTISASISELIWVRGSAIVSTFNGVTQAPSGAIFTVFSGVIGIVIVAHISAYLTTVEGRIGDGIGGGIGRGFSGGFSGGVAVYVAAFFSNVVGLSQALIIGVNTTHGNNCIEKDSEAPISACSNAIYNSGFMRNFSQTFKNDADPYGGTILHVVILIENILGDVSSCSNPSFMPAEATVLTEFCFHCLKASVDSCIINDC